jgi:hypothetical protein
MNPGLEMPSKSMKFHKKLRRDRGDHRKIFACLFNLAKPFSEVSASSVVNYKVIFFHQ